MEECTWKHFVDWKALFKCEALLLIFIKYAILVCNILNTLKKSQYLH